jgi:hypothetical protein
VQQPPTEPSGDPFTRSKALLDSIITDLQSTETAQLTHAQIEDHITARGRQLQRCLYQDHLDLRAVQEADRHEVIGADAIARTRTERGHRRKLATVFGEVIVARKAYRAPGAANLHPADATLNLPVERHSHGLRKLAAIEAARGSFEDAANAITRATGPRSANAKPNSSPHAPLWTSPISTKPASGERALMMTCWSSPPTAKAS